MDPVTAAIIAALSAGAIGGLTETSKTAIADGYKKLKDLLAKKYGEKSQLVVAVDQLEAKPSSAGRQETLQEEMLALRAEQDADVLAAAKHLHTLVQPQQAGFGKFNIQNTGPVQGQNIGDFNTNTQYFGDIPKK